MLLYYRFYEGIFNGKYLLAVVKKGKLPFVLTYYIINVQPDHVHTILSVPPKYAISDMMGFLKGKMALNLFN